jgi:hypothetical protein
VGIRISWVDINGAEEGHKIYRSTSPMDPESLPSPLATLPPNVTHYDDGSGVLGTYYYYRVSAYAGAVERVSEEILAYYGESFDPVSLYESGRFGAVYDPYDTSTLWQDAAGTVPVTAHGQLVARMDDKSGNGLHQKQPTSGLRPTFSDVSGLRSLVFSDPAYMVSDVFTSNLLADGFVFAAANNADANALGWLLGEYEVASILDRVYLMVDTRTNKLGALYNPDGISVTVTYDSELDTNPHTLGFVDEGSVGRLYVDGITQVSSSAPTGGFSAGDRKLLLGDRSQLDGQFEGHFYGAVLGNGAISSTDISNINIWLSQRAGLL